MSERGACCAASNCSRPWYDDSPSLAEKALSLLMVLLYSAAIFNLHFIIFIILAFR